MKEFTNQDNIENKEKTVESLNNEDAVEKVENNLSHAEFERKNQEQKMLEFQTLYKLSSNFYAGFFIRALAYLVDSIIVFCIANIFNTLTFTKLDIRLPIEILGQDVVIALIVYVLYFVIMTYFLGQTLGKMLFKIKVEKNTGGRLSFLDVIFREIVVRIINNIIFLTYLIIPFNNKKKGLHDFVADSVVIKEDFQEIREKLNDMLKVKEQ